jgi:hypothetical protein
VVDLGGKARALVIGDSSACAVLENGAVRCWGDGSFGNLGYGDRDKVGDDETPASLGKFTLPPR